MNKRWKSIIDTRLYKYEDAGYHASVYFVQGSNQSCLIDPSVGQEELKKGWCVDMMVLTHGHADHIWAVDRYRQEEDIPLLIHQADSRLLTDSDLNGTRLFGQVFSAKPASRTFLHGEEIVIDESLSLVVFHSPGHTKGSSCFLLKDKVDNQPLALLTGDTLFPGSIGRSDLPGGDSAEMETSLTALRRFMKTLPADLALLAGHGPVSQVGRELKYNPYLQKR